LNTLRKILILFSLLIYTIHTHAQFLGDDLLDGQNNQSISFDYIGGFIIVDVWYNDVIPLKFIFDTGASNTILFDRFYADIFNVTYADTIDLVGADISSEIEGYILRGGKFRIQGLNRTVKRDYIALSEGYIKLEKTLGIKVDGILGSDFFKRLTIKINYRKGKINIINPNKTKFNSKWAMNDIKIINGKPYLNSTLKIDSSQTECLLLLDTGASISLLVHTDKVKDLKIPENSIEGYLGTGLGGNILGHIGMVDELVLNTHSFNGIICNFQNLNVDSLFHRNIVREGIVGNTILSRFHVAIDYVHQKLYLKPNKRFKRPFNIDRSGLIIHAFGKSFNQFIIHYVYPGSTADKAGIKKGDIITKFGRKKSNKLTLQYLTRKLSRKEGKKIKMQFLRENTYHDKIFYLENLVK